MNHLETVVKTCFSDNAMDIALAMGRFYRIESSRRVLRFGLTIGGVAELRENILGGIGELTRRCKAQKRAENERKRQKAMVQVRDWRAIIAASAMRHDLTIASAMRHGLTPS